MTACRSADPLGRVAADGTMAPLFNWFGLAAGRARGAVGGVVERGAPAQQIERITQVAYR
jgi:hypothetical protein